MLVQQNYESNNHAGRPCTVLYRTHAKFIFVSLLNPKVGGRKNLQFAINRFSQLKSVLQE